jgi:general secretion pathway protein G
MRKTRQRITKGFTMIELMAVLIILGLLFTLVATRVTDQIDRARVVTTKTNLKMLHTKISEFKMDTSQFPTEEEGLYALIEPPTDVENYPQGGYLETTDIPRDAWGREFYYERYPEGGGDFRIVSWGADGEEGGEGYDADLYSTDAY